MHIRRLVPYLNQALLLALALVPFYPGVFFRGEVLVPMSHLYEHAPWASYRPPDLEAQDPFGREVTSAVCVWYSLTDAAFDRGEWPLWNPLQFMGEPLIGNYQTAVFYPPRLLFRLFDDTYVAMTVYILVRFWLCGFNAFVAARIFGLRPPFANLFSFLYMLAGYNQLWTFYPPPDVMAWAPLLLAASESLLNLRYRLGTAIMTIAFTMSLLAAHPSTAIAASAGTALYALLRMAAQRVPMRHVLRCAGCGVLALALSLAVCAVQLFPFIEYMPEMAMIVDRYYPDGVRHYAYSAYDLLALWGGRMRGTQLEGTFWGTTNHTYVGMLYLGTMTWVCLSLLASRLPFDRAGRHRVRILLAVSAVCLYSATSFPLTDLVNRLPLMSGVRPAYLIAFPTVALPLAAAFALQAWIDGKPALRSLARPVAAAAGIALLVAVAVGAAPYLSPEYAAQTDLGVDLATYMLTQLGIAAGLTCAGFLVLAQCARFSGRSRGLVWALCALAVGDQAVSMRGVIAATPREYVMPETPITNFLSAQRKPCRVRFDTADIPPGYPTLYGIEELWGYDAVYPRRTKPFLDDLDLTPGTAADALLSCDFYLFRDGAALPNGFEDVASADGIRIARNRSAIPRARLVDEVVSFESSTALFAAMDRPDFDPRATVFTDKPIGFALPRADHTDPGEAVITAWRADRVVVEANARKPCVLVLAESYYPGWEAAVDGEPTPIFPAYHLYRGVHLGAGKHTVEFAYRPSSVRYGLMVSFAAVALSACCALGFMRRARA